MIVIPQQARDQPCERVRACLTQAQALCSGRAVGLCRRDPSRRREAEQQKRPPLVWHELKTGLTVSLLRCETRHHDMLRWYRGVSNLSGPCHGSAGPLGQDNPSPARILRPLCLRGRLGVSQHLAAPLEPPRCRSGGHRCTREQEPCQDVPVHSTAM